MSYVWGKTLVKVSGEEGAPKEEQAIPEWLVRAGIAAAGAGTGAAIGYMIGKRWGAVAGTIIGAIAGSFSKQILEYVRGGS